MEVLSCIFVIMGVIIGAGFASGKEIYTFFYVYGEKGIIGIIISAVLIGYAIYKSFKIIKKYDINTYNELLRKIIVNKNHKNINIEKILNFIINIFLLITFFVMCAGFSAYFKQEFGINEIFSSIIIAILSYLILSKNTKGIFLLNSILIPFIITILIILGIKNLNVTTREVKTIVESNMWITKAILYASYNCITLISMLMPMKRYIKEKKTMLKISIFSTFIIILLAIIIFNILTDINIDISQIDLPAVYASRNVWKNI